MKKVLSIVFMVMAMMMAMPASAQINFGVKGGLNVTSMSFDKDVFDTSNRAGFFFGPTVKVTLPLVGLGIDASALYNRTSTKVTYDDYVADDIGYSMPTKNIELQTIDIPVNLRYGIGLSSLANVFVFAGPQWSINVGNKDFVWDERTSYSLKKATVSANVGFGVTVLKHLQLTANYNIACSKTAELYTFDPANISTVSENKRNNTWQIALGYWF